jgi:hypothetical protein
MTLSIATNYHYAECHDLFIVMLSVKMLSVVMLSVNILSVAMLIVNMLSVVMLNVSMLCGMPPYYQVDIDTTNGSRVDKVSFLLY